MDMNEPGAAVLNLFDQLVERVKQTQPMRSDDKPLKGGSVYSMMTLGMPVDPADYMNPWSPQGTQTVAQAAPPPAPVAASSDPSAAVPPPPPSPEDARALAAAWKTSLLATQLLAVTDDQTYQLYPEGKSLVFAYQAILAGMQPIDANEADDPNVLAAIAKANKALFLPAADGTYTTNPTQMYQNYMDNTDAYGATVANYAVAYATARSNPAQFAIFPVTSKPLHDQVTRAKNKLIAEGSQTIEAALDALASVGHPYQAQMVAAARSAYKDWDLQLAGAVPASNPYCLILPTDWASDDKNACQGWQTISVDQSSYSSYSTSHAASDSRFSWFNKSSSVGGSGGVFLGFAAFGGNASHASSSQGSDSSNSSSQSSSGHTDAKGLRIKMSYALCTVIRPWFVGDLFAMKGWYLKGGKKSSISTGKIADQIQNSDQLLPMIPQRMLVVRNVSITATDWGSVGSQLETSYGASQQSSSASADHQAGSAGFSLGFISFGGSASHSSSEAQGQGSSFQVKDANSSFGTTFQQNTLTIPGAQILGWLCDIVSPSAPEDDPMFGKNAPVAAAPVAEPVPVAVGAGH
jgi:hypothetical protein